MIKKIFFTSISFLFTLCSYAQVDAISPNSTQNETTEEVSDTLPLDSIYALYFRTTVPYEWVSYRMKVNFESEKMKRTFQLFYVNRIDSIIYLNVSVSGIELVRLVLLPEQVTYVNKLSYEYYQGDYNILAALLGFPLNFNMCQAIFNGIDFAGYERNFQLLEHNSETQLVSPLRCDSTNADNNVCLSQDIYLDNHYQLKKNHITTLTNATHSLLLNYDKYSQTAFGAFFNNLSIEIPSERIKVKAELKSVKFNTPGPTSIKIPESFTPVDLMK